MSKYYKHNEENEATLIEDLKKLGERSGKDPLFEKSELNDFLNQKKELEKSYDSMPKRKQKDLKMELDNINKAIDKYTHIWVMQLAPRDSNEKQQKKALTVIYKAKKTVVLMSALIL